MPTKKPARSTQAVLGDQAMQRRRQDQVRAQIQAGNIATRLQQAVDGKITLTSVQAQIAIALLRKVLPDLSSIDQTVSGDESRPIRITITNA